MAGPLDGIRVLEVAHMVAGPACGQILGDLGADVVKLEPPAGDITRSLGPAPGGLSALYASTNRGKRSVALDLRRPEDQARARALAAKADVLVSNVDGAMLEKAGLDAATLKSVHPRLIHVEITGFGPGGPPGTDGLAQAGMGLMSQIGAADGPGWRTGPSIVDVSTGVWAALAVLAALRRRDQTGQGERIQTSLAEVCLFLQYSHLALENAQPGLIRRRGNHSPISCTPVLDCADGRLIVTILHDRHWQVFCRILDLEALAADPRFADNERRCGAQDELEAAVAPVTRQRDRAHWTALLRAQRIPCGPERSYAEVLADPDLRARGLLRDIAPGHLQVALPVGFAELETAPPRPAPGLGGEPDPWA